MKGREWLWQGSKSCDDPADQQMVSLCHTHTQTHTHTHTQSKPFNVLTSSQEKQIKFHTIRGKKAGDYRFKLHIRIISQKGAGTFRSVTWALVRLWPGLIKEIVVFSRKVCTCSSTSVTTLINCTLRKRWLGSSLTGETKVEGHVVGATQQIRAVCHRMLPGLVSGRKTEKTPSLATELFRASFDVLYDGRRQRRRNP